MAPSPAPFDSARTQTLTRLAAAQGLAFLGVAPAQASEYEPYVRQWLAQGQHGEMQYLTEHLEERIDPQQFLAGARSVICVAQPYESFERADSPAQPAGRVARYAQGKDYHVTLKKKLHDLADELRAVWPEHQFRSAVDTAPVLERELAARAGLGWVGKHTLLIHPQRGSWFCLGEIVTTLPLQTAQDIPGGSVTDHCGTCTRCIDACPTKCISADGYQMNGSRCISYLTIEHRGIIPLELHSPIGDWLAGCDVCQEVCPFNVDAQSTGTPVQFNLLEVLNWDGMDRQKAFSGSALKRIKLEQFKRNALIVAGNHLAKQDDAALQSRIEAMAKDADQPPLVRDTAGQVLQKLAASGPIGA